MKTNPLFQWCNLLSFVILVTITTIDTTAQTSVKPAIHVNSDTVRQVKKISSFDVQLLPDKDGEKFILSITNPFEEKLKISISGNGTSGFTDRTSQLTYHKRINMTNAEDGNYVVTVTSGINTFRRTINLTSTEYNRNLHLEYIEDPQLTPVTQLPLLRNLFS